MDALTPQDWLDTATGSEAHLRSILATAPDAMVAIDGSGRILWFNRAAERMFGYAQAEVVGENVSLLMPSPDREKHDGYIRRYLRTGERHIIGSGRVVSARRRDGTAFPIELFIGETQLSEARVFTGFIRDLTERQKTERRLQELQEELARIAHVSTAGTLASTLAHELNQPLAAIANYMAAARDLVTGPGKEAALLRDALGEAAAEVMRAGLIVRKLRDFITRGESAPQAESLKKLVTEACALAMTGSGAKGIEVELRLNPRTDLVMVDRIPVQQALFNLIRNAIEAMEESPVRRLEIASSKEVDGQVRIAVSDSGTGLSDEAISSLFEPFKNPRETGLGLGLSICRSIVEAQGGKIWVERGRIGGTTVQFTLPVCRIPQSRRKRKDGETESDSPPAVTHRPNASAI